VDLEQSPLAADQIQDHYQIRGEFINFGVLFGFALPLLLVLSMSMWICSTSDCLSDSFLLFETLFLSYTSSERTNQNVKNLATIFDVLSEFAWVMIFRCGTSVKKDSIGSFEGCVEC
jgi:hypothetical protein